MKERARYLNIIADTVITVFGVLATVCIIPTAYETPFHLLTLVLVEVPLAFLVCEALHKAIKRWWIPCVIVLAAALTLFLIREESMVGGAKLLWYSAASLLFLDFSFLPTPVPPEDVIYPAASVTEFMVVMAAVLTVITAVLLIKCKSPIPSLILPVPAFVLGFIYTDCPPALFTVVLLLLYWCGVIFGRELFKKEEPSLGLGKLIFMALLALLVILIPLISPQSSFRPIPFSERRGFLDTVGTMRDRLLAQNTSNPKEYDLSIEGDREVDHTKAFSINSSVAGAFLLRTHSYGKYSGSMWKSSQEFYGSWNSQLALGSTQNGTQEFLRIRDAYMNERLTPYSVLSRYDVTPGESSVKANGKTAYVWVFRPQPQLVPVATSTAEERYANFAKEQYTMNDGPQKNRLLKFLEDSIGSEWIDTIRSSDSYTAALYVSDFVQANGTYSLTPGYTPIGKDFVEYFLTEGRRGYCVHFASAAAALLQAMDIPARYVIGYRVEVDTAETWMNIERDNAHAWVEVYVRGVGWLPVECTPGFEPTGIYSSTNLNPFMTPEPTPEPEITRRPDQDFPLPSDTPRPTRNPGPRPSRNPSVTPEPENPGTRSPAKIGLWLLIGLPVALLIWQGVGAVIRLKRKRSFEQEDSRAAVIAMLRYINSLEKYGVVPPDNAEELGDEAAFSTHSMEKAQSELLKEVEVCKLALCRRTPTKRFLLKWFKFVI